MQLVRPVLQFFTMTKIDRYVLSVFLRVFLICFVSLSGMFVMGDFVGHIAEFGQHVEPGRSLASILGQFYGARIPWLFDILGKVVALVAAAFTITWMQRNNELTALLAAGVPRWRVLRPVLIATGLIGVAAAVNRELVLPSLRPQLTREARNFDGQEPRAVRSLRDQQTDILLGGRYTISSERRILQPNFVLPAEFASFGTRLLAENANWSPPQPHHPAGYFLYEVREPSEIDKIPSAAIDGRTVVYTRHDFNWIRPNMCFVATNLPFELVEGGTDWRRLASTGELLAQMRNESLDFGADEQLTVHGRLLQPVMDVMLLLLGLPFAIARGSRNVFVAVGSCLGMVVVYFIVTAIAHSLGLNGMLAPVTAAWLPLLLFTPLVILLSSPFRE